MPDKLYRQLTPEFLVRKKIRGVEYELGLVLAENYDPASTLQARPDQHRPWDPEGSMRLGGLAPHSIWQDKTPEIERTLDRQHAIRERMERYANRNVPEAVWQKLKRDSEIRKLAKPPGFGGWQIDMPMTAKQMIEWGLVHPSVALVTRMRQIASAVQEQVTQLSQVRPPHIQELQLPHEAVNIFDMCGAAIPYLASTWWMFHETLHEEMVEFQKVDESRKTLEETLFKRLLFEPGKDAKGENQRLHGARYEMPKYGESSLYPEALFKHLENPLTWMDFMTGMPLGVCEMLVLAGEVTTPRDKWPVYPQKGITPALPLKYFEEERYDVPPIYNYLWLAHERANILAEPLSGEYSMAAAPNWWLRINFVEEDTAPFPGEFVGLGVRMFSNLISGLQKYNPFLYSGHWFDTAYVTSAEAIVAERHEDGYFICTVNWRTMGEIKVYPTDFASHQKGQRIVILKTLGNKKTSQLWKDEDCFEFDEEEDIWRAAPITYYGRGFEEEPGDGEG